MLRCAVRNPLRKKPIPEHALQLSRIALSLHGRAPGRLVEAALSDWEAAKAKREKSREECSWPPMIIIMSADAGMEVVASEVRSQGLEAHVVKSVGELGPLLKALGAIDHIGPGQCPLPVCQRLQVGG